MSNRVVWFDLPVRDLARAVKFYSAVLDAEVREDYPGVAVIIAHDSDEASGCLLKSDSESPSATGVLVYFSVNGRLDAAVAAAVENGGRILKHPYQIGTFGRRAIVVDSEGNRIALHST